MRLPSLHTHRSGFLLIELLLGLMLFLMFVGGVIFSQLDGRDRQAMANDHQRAAYLSQQALEGVRSIRDVDFSVLTPGTYGVKLINGVWAFSGTSVGNGGFYTSVTISSPATDRRSIVATTSWSFTTKRWGTVTLTAELTDWHAVSSSSASSG